MFRTECSQHTLASSLKCSMLPCIQSNSSLGDTGSREVNHSSNGRDKNEILFTTLS